MIAHIAMHCQETSSSALALSSLARVFEFSLVLYAVLLSPGCCVVSVHVRSFSGLFCAGDSHHPTSPETDNDLFLIS